QDRLRRIGVAVRVHLGAEPRASARARSMLLGWAASRGARLTPRPASGRSGRPKLLILTPDFPPAHGGIQTMSHRFAVGLRGFERRVVTLEAPGANAFDRESRLAIRRVAAPRRIHGRAALLNPVALATAVAF